MLLLLAVFLLPVVAAWVLYAYRDHVGFVGSAAHGTLIRPARPLPAVALTQPDGAPLTLDDLKGKWTLVVLAPAPCDQLCRTDLHQTRQVRLALNEDIRRVQRLWVLPAPAGADALADQLKDHQDLLVASGGGDAMERFLAPFRLPGEPINTWAVRIYIMDPQGNVLMYYPPGADPKGILKDMKRLLKVSQVG